MDYRICLLVDDESAIRSYLRAILEPEGFQCLESENVAQALGITQRLGGRLDLIVTDIKMPGDMDGLDLAYSVRHSFPNVPVILVSGYADDEAVFRAASKFKFIRKPFVPDTIVNAVRAAVERSAKTATNESG